MINRISKLTGEVTRLAPWQSLGVWTSEEHLLRCLQEKWGHEFTYCYVYTKPVIYVAHPVSPDSLINAFKTVAWIKWLTLNDPSRVYVAPWVAEVLAFPETTNESFNFEEIIYNDQTVVSRLDGILLVGGKISKGMALELECAQQNHKYITDMSQYATPNDLPEGFFLDPAPED